MMHAGPTQAARWLPLVQRRHRQPPPSLIAPQHRHRNTQQKTTGPDQRAPPPALPRGAAHEYRYLTEFQSHEPEFDYLKSLEIEEKIDKVRWCRSSSARMLLSTNDKTVKLWKVGGRARAAGWVGSAWDELPCLTSCAPGGA